MKKLNAISWIFSISVIFLLGGCYPQGATYVDELDLVVSIENKEVDYQAYNSFYIEPDVLLISNDSKDSLLDKNDADFLVGEFRMRMLELGWTEITDSASVDSTTTAILMTVLENVNVSYVSGGWGWGGWGGWGWWGYPCCGYYPGYPGYGGCCYTSIYAYTTGSLIIEMIDPSSIAEDGQFDRVPVVWGGGINGYLEGSTSNIRTRVKNSMDQMIEDSPYLKQN